MKAPRVNSLKNEISRLAGKFSLGDRSEEYAEWHLWDMSTCQLAKTDRVVHPSGPYKVAGLALGEFELVVLPFMDAQNTDENEIIPEQYSFLGNGEVLKATFPSILAPSSDVGSVTLTGENIRVDQRTRVAQCLQMATVTEVHIVRTKV